MDLKEYPVVIGGVTHTMQLDEAEARRLGVFEKPTAAPKPNGKRAPKASNKAAPKPKDKAATPPASEDEGTENPPASDEGTDNTGDDW